MFGGGIVKGQRDFFDTLYIERLWSDWFMCNFRFFGKSLEEFLLEVVNLFFGALSDKLSYEFLMNTR